MTNCQGVINSNLKGISNKITSDRKHQVKFKNVGCQNDIKKERDRKSFKREETYYEVTKQVYSYHGSRSFEDIGVGSVKAFHKRKVKKVYLPETDERAVGCSKLSYLFRKSRQRLRRSYFDIKNTSSKCVGGIVNNSTAVHKKLSAIVLNNHKETGSDTAIKNLVNTTTQVEDAFDEIVAVTKLNPKAEGQIKAEIKKEKVQSKPNKKGDFKHSLQRKETDGSTESEQYVQNLETPSGKRSSDLMGNKLERDYWSLFLCKSKDKKSSSEKCSKDKCSKSASLLKRRFEALRRGLTKKDDSKRNINDYKPSSLKNQVLCKDASVNSDPPSLESRSFSNMKIFSPNLSKSDRGNFGNKFYERNSIVCNVEKGLFGANNNESETHRKRFRRWGRKHDEGYHSPTVECYKPCPNNKYTVVKDLPSRHEGKKESKKFFFFKKKVKNKDNKPSKIKNEVIVRHCDISEGLVLKVQATNTPEKRNPKREAAKNDVHKSEWLNKFCSKKLERKTSVKVRWNNRKYATSSSTLFELIDHVYKDTGNLFKSKSEITGYTDSFKYVKTPPVNFMHRDIETWMIPTTIYNRQPTNLRSKSEDRLNADKHKHFIDRSKAFSEKLEVVLHTTKFKRISRRLSSDYLRIGLPKGYFSESRSNNLSSNEEVYKIVEYDTGSDLKTEAIKLESSNNDVDYKIMDASLTKDKRDEKRKDDTAKDSVTFVPKNCDVRVGIIAPRDLREIQNNKTNENESSESESNSNLRRCDVTESYLKDYYQYWAPMGFDFCSWCVSDCHLEWGPDSLDSIYKFEGTRSCPNIYEDFFTSTQPITCLSQTCSHSPQPEHKHSIKFSCCRHKKKNIEPESKLKRALPKDSIEVHKSRQLYALSLRFMWKTSSGNELCSSCHSNRKIRITDVAVQDSDGSGNNNNYSKKKSSGKKRVSLAEDLDCCVIKYSCPSKTEYKNNFENEHKDESQDSLKNQVLQPILHPPKRMSTKFDTRDTEVNTEEMPVDSDESRCPECQQKDCGQFLPSCMIWVSPKPQDAPAMRIACPKTAKTLCGLLSNSCTTQNNGTDSKVFPKQGVKTARFIASHHSETKTDNTKQKLEDFCRFCKGTLVHNISCGTSFDKNNTNSIRFESISTKESSCYSLHSQTMSPTTLSSGGYIQDIFHSRNVACQRPMYSGLKFYRRPSRYLSSTHYSYPVTPEARSAVCSPRPSSHHHLTTHSPPTILPLRTSSLVYYTDCLTPGSSTHRCVTTCKDKIQTRCYRLPPCPRVICTPTPSYVRITVPRHPRIEKPRVVKPKKVKPVKEKKRYYCVMPPCPKSSCKLKASPPPSPKQKPKKTKVQPPSPAISPRPSLQLTSRPKIPQPKTPVIHRPRIRPHPQQRSSKPILQQPCFKPIYQQPCHKPTHRQPCHKPSHHRGRSKPTHHQPYCKPAHHQPCCKPSHHYHQPCYKSTPSQPCCAPSHHQPCSKPTHPHQPPCNGDPFPMVWLKAPRICPTSSCSSLRARPSRCPHVKQCPRPCPHPMPVGCPSPTSSCATPPTCLCKSPSSPCRQACRPKRAQSPCGHSSPCPSPSPSCPHCGQKTTVKMSAIEATYTPSRHEFRVNRESRHKSHGTLRSPKMSQTSMVPKYSKHQHHQTSHYLNEPQREHTTTDTNSSFNNSREIINITLVNGAPKSVDVKEDYNVKVQNEEGVTLYERRRAKRNNPKRMILGDMYKSSQVYKTETHIAKRNPDSGSYEQLIEKSHIDDANTIEIQLRLKVPKDKDNELHIENIEGSEKQIMCHSLDKVQSDNANIFSNKSDINIRILIKKIKPKENKLTLKYKEEPLNEPRKNIYSKDTETRSEHCVYSETQTLNTSLLVKPSIESTESLTDYDMGDLMSTDHSLSHISTGDQVRDNRSLTSLSKRLDNKVHKYVQVNTVNTLHITNNSDAVSHTTNDLNEDIDCEHTHEERNKMLKKLVQCAYETNKSKLHVKQIKDMLKVVLTTDFRQPHDKNVVRTNSKEGIDDKTNYEDINEMLKRLVQCAYENNNSKLHVKKIKDMLKLVLTSDSRQPDDKIKTENDFGDKCHNITNEKTILQGTTSQCPKQNHSECNSGADESVNVACVTDRSKVSPVKCQCKSLLSKNPGVHCSKQTDLKYRRSKTCDGTQNNVLKINASTTMSKNVKICRKKSVAKSQFAPDIHVTQCEIRRMDTNTTVDKDKIVVLSTNNTEICKEPLLPMSNPIANIRASEILQSYETKKAVLEIYTQKFVSDKGECLVAKLPKFLYGKEQDIQTNYEEMVSNKYKTVCKRNIVMMSIKR